MHLYPNCVHRTFPEFFFFSTDGVLYLLLVNIICIVLKISAAALARAACINSLMRIGRRQKTPPGVTHDTKYPAASPQTSTLPALGNASHLEHIFLCRAAAICRSEDTRNVTALERIPKPHSGRAAPGPSRCRMPIHVPLLTCELRSVQLSPQDLPTPQHKLRFSARTAVL